MCGRITCKDLQRGLAGRELSGTSVECLKLLLSLNPGTVNAGRCGMCLSQSTRSSLSARTGRSRQCLWNSLAGGKVSISAGAALRSLTSRGSTAQPGLRSSPCPQQPRPNKPGSYSEAGCPDRVTQVKWPSSKLCTSVFR